MPKYGRAVVRITLSNVCGSDLHVWRGELDPRKRNWALPRHHGHEMTGYIEKLGEGVTSDSDGQPLKEGDRVVYQYFFPCGRCKNCLAGRSRACPLRYAHSAVPCDRPPYFNGGWGDYFYLRPRHTVFTVPDHLSDDLVVGVNCAFSQVVCGLDVGNLQMGETVVIQGAGGLGLYAIAVAKERGAGQVIVVDGVPERLEVATMFGADDVLDMRDVPEMAQRIKRVKELTGGWGADIVLELAGFPQVAEEGVQMLGSGGRYVEIGNISPGLTYQADPSLWVTQNITVIGNNHYGRKHLRDALDIISRSRDKYPFDKIVSHKFPLEEINEVFAAQNEGHITRASLVP